MTLFPFCFFFDNFSSFLSKIIQTFFNTIKNYHSVLKKNLCDLYTLSFLSYLHNAFLNFVKMGAQYSQIFPPSPKVTEKNLADQTGKVCHMLLGGKNVNERVTSRGLVVNSSIIGLHYHWGLLRHRRATGIHSLSKKRQSLCRCPVPRQSRKSDWRNQSSRPRLKGTAYLSSSWPWRLDNDQSNCGCLPQRKRPVGRPLEQRRRHDSAPRQQDQAGLREAVRHQ